MGRRKKKVTGLGHTFRSGFEKTIALQLEEAGVKFDYEKEVITYVDPAVLRKYLPDFILDNGIIVEVKGRWTLDDRKKMVLVMEQNPSLDIRILFMRDQPINKGAKVKYSEWCEKRGIKYAVGSIPKEWLSGNSKQESTS